MSSNNRESLIVIVGFLGSGKTTLLKRLVNHYLYGFWNPYVILNDYQNAQIDAQFFREQLSSKQIEAISGSCICCSGINELRQTVNNIPSREKGITFIEANGTTDASTLLGFLGIGLKEVFFPPIQVGVVDVRHWQRRGDNNELEASQIQASSLVVLNYDDAVDSNRREEVRASIMQLNPTAMVATWENLNDEVLPQLTPSQQPASSMDHNKSHWSSCSVDLPDPMPSGQLKEVLGKIPDSVLRVKGCTKLDESKEYTFFERTPTGEVFYRPFKGRLISGSQLLTIGPGSDPENLLALLNQSSFD